MMGGLRKGDRVLIHAAAGGVGISATQIARSRGAEIFGTASASKHDAIRAQGVDHPIDYRTQDFEQEVRRLTGGEGVDLIMDATGPDQLPQGLPPPPAGRAADHVRRLGAQHAGRAAASRTLARGLLRMPLATIPWWKSLS